MRSWVEHLERFDWTLLTSALALLTLGLIGLYGIGLSQEPTSLFLFHKQLTVGIMGIIVVFVLSWFNYQSLRSYAMIAYILGIFVLIAVLIFGSNINGTTGWFRLGTLSFQPVEFAKILLVIYLGAYFSKYSHTRLSWNVFLLSLLPTLVYVALVMLQPDFGSAMTLLGIWFFMAAFTGLPRFAWIIIPLTSLLLVTGVWNYGLKSYQKDRVMNFLHPENDVRGTGYNAIQARIAIGSGGWLGKGVGEGSQARLRFLPVSSTDFIIAVIGEEMGFVGLIVVLCLYLLVFYRFLKIAFESQDEYASLLLIGVGGMLIVHIGVNMGMNFGLLPITGIPLPFLSSASSFLLAACFAGIGIAESIATRRPSPYLQKGFQE